MKIWIFVDFPGHIALKTLIWWGLTRRVFELQRAYTPQNLAEIEGIWMSLFLSQSDIHGESSGRKTAPGNRNPPWRPPGRCWRPSGKEDRCSWAAGRGWLPPWRWREPQEAHKTHSQKFVVVHTAAQNKVNSAAGLAWLWRALQDTRSSNPIKVRT